MNIVELNQNEISSVGGAFNEEQERSLTGSIVYIAIFTVVQFVAISINVFYKFGILNPVIDYVKQTCNYHSTKNEVEEVEN